MGEKRTETGQGCLGGMEGIGKTCDTRTCTSKRCNDDRTETTVN